jgi:hypothetical protein
MFGKDIRSVLTQCRPQIIKETNSQITLTWVTSVKTKTVLGRLTLRPEYFVGEFSGDIYDTDSSSRARYTEGYTVKFSL